MSSKSKRRGYQVEIYIRDKLLEVGIPCERVPLSGLMGGKYSGDLSIPSVAESEFRAEVKARRSGEGFSVLEKWMKDNDIMFLKRNNKDPMVVLSWEAFKKLIGFYYDNKK